MLSFFKKHINIPAKKVNPILLVVAENKITQHPPRRNFEALQSKVNSAVSGQSALNYLETGPLPDLTILDLIFSDTNGLKLQELISEYKGYSEIPIIPLLFALSDNEEDGGRSIGEIPTGPIEINATPSALLYSVANSLKRHNVALSNAYREKIQNLNRSFTTSIEKKSTGETS